METDSGHYLRYSGDLDRYYGENLPHWDIADGIFFVTFCLADALSSQDRRKLAGGYEQRIRAAKRDAGRASVSDEGLDHFIEETDPRLDRGRGCCQLEIPCFARTVRDAIRHFDGDRYALITWAIMPNHAHVVFRRLSAEHRLRDILHSWKSYTANRAVDLLGEEPFPADEKGRTRVWQHESFDRLVRTEAELQRVVRYTARNPDDAGLTPWPWWSIERSWRRVVSDRE